jgi:hypothetical protein
LAAYRHPTPVLRRSIVYASTPTCGLVIYAGTVLVLDLLLRSGAAPLVTPAAAATAPVLFPPLRLRIEHSVDRLLARADHDNEPARIPRPVVQPQQPQPRTRTPSRVPSTRCSGIPSPATSPTRST